MTDTDPTPERRWTLSEGRYRTYAIFRTPTGGHFSMAYDPDIQAVLTALNEAEALRAERDHWFLTLTGVVGACEMLMTAVKSRDTALANAAMLIVKNAGQLLDKELAAGADGGERRGG